MLCIDFEGNTASILTYLAVSVAVANKGRMPYQKNYQI